MIRLLVEYVWGYVGAIRRAPLSPQDRLRCFGHLLRWIGSRALPGASRRVGQSPDPALEGRVGGHTLRRPTRTSSGP